MFELYRPPLVITTLLALLLAPAAAALSAETSAGSLPLAISHRGCTLRCPENTLAAFAWADRVGADAIELDIRVSADGHLVVLHDKTVNRTTNGTGAVKRLTLAELRALDAGAGERVPTMEETLAFASRRNMRLLLDMKGIDSDDTSRIVRSLNRYGIAHNVIIGARSIEHLRAFKAVNASLTTLAFAKEPELIQAFMDEGVDIVRLWARWANARPELIEEIRGRGRQVWVTTGNLRGSELEQIMAYGVDGVITDYPTDVARIARRQHLALNAAD